MKHFFFYMYDVYVFVNRYSELKWKQLHKSPSNFFLLSICFGVTPLIVILTSCNQHQRQKFYGFIIVVVVVHHRCYRCSSAAYERFKDGISLGRFEKECWMHGRMRWKVMVFFTHHSFNTSEKMPFFVLLGLMNESRHKFKWNNADIRVRPNDEHQNTKRCTLRRQNGIAPQKRKNVFHSFNYLVPEIIFRVKF